MYRNALSQKARPHINRLLRNKRLPRDRKTVLPKCIDTSLEPPKGTVLLAVVAGDRLRGRLLREPRGPPELASSLCCSRGGSRSLQRGHVGEEGPPLQPGEDPAQPLGLQRAPDEEGEAEGGPQSQEADITEEGERCRLWNLALEQRSPTGAPRSPKGW